MNICLIFRVNNLILIVYKERNNLSFIETSALDSTNVESAFQNILTGNLDSYILNILFVSVLVDVV